MYDSVPCLFLFGVVLVVPRLGGFGLTFLQWLIRKPERVSCDS
jgi:hypothetical protein